MTRSAQPKCCVSFSAFFNKSVVPCSTCACGCTAAVSTCSKTAAALLLPSKAVVVPFENRTEMATAFAKDNDRTLPDPLPCGDNCGVTINWHLLSDYVGGWTARMTIFNWGESSFADWFAAVELEEAMAGFEQAYTFNGSRLNKTMLLLQGRPGLNYLVGGRQRRKDGLVPGTQQSVISFTKRNTAGLKVVGGDRFPSRVYFNGLECLVPPSLPISRSSQGGVTLGFVVLLFLQILVWPTA